MPLVTIAPLALSPWGTSTAAAVKANGNCSRIEVASEPSEWEVWLAVERAFDS